MDACNCQRGSQRQTRHVSCGFVSSRQFVRNRGILSFKFSTSLTGLRRGFTLAPLLATNLRLCCGFAGGGRSWTMACSQSDSLQRADTHPPLLARQAQSPLSAHARRRMSRDLARTQQDLRQRGARAHAVTLGKVFSDSPAMAQRSSGHGPATLRIGKPQQGDASVLMQALNDR